MRTRAAAKRKRKRRVDEEEDEDMEDDDVLLLQVYAPGTAPPPPPKRPKGDGKAVGNGRLATETRLKKQERSTVEVNYKGKTRTVLGPGFQVREILFGDEYTSLRVNNWKGGQDVDALKGFVERKAANLGFTAQYGRVIEHVDVEVDGVLLHFVSKSVAKRLFGYFCNAQRVEIKPLKLKPTELPEAITREEVTGRVTVTWAEGAAKGSAWAYFAGVDSANAFLIDWRNKREKFADTHVYPIGVLEQDPYRPPSHLPPLKSMPGYYTIFDDAKIVAMLPHEVEALIFRVEFPWGIPHNMDEYLLEERLLPHRIIRCTISRDDVPNRRQSERLVRQRRIAPLVSYLSREELCVDWRDEVSKRAGVSVNFKNEARFNQVFDIVNATWGWAEMETPLGQPVRLGKEYISRFTLDRAVYQQFSVKVSGLRAHLEVKGVQSEVNVNHTTVEIIFCSRNIISLEHSAASLEKIIECEKMDTEHVNHIIFNGAAMTKVRKWAKDRASKHFVSGQSGACVRIDHEDESIWVYGDKVGRDHAFQSFAELVAKLSRKLEDLQRFALVDAGEVYSHRGAKKRSVRPQDTYHKSLVLQPVTKLPDRNKRQVASSPSLSSDAADGLRSWRSTWLAEAELNPDERVRECGVCMTPADEPIVDFIQCGHSFCLECIQPGITPASQLPFLCPAANCGSPVHVRDVSVVSNDGDAIVTTAVFEYVKRHVTTCVVCPKVACNQILLRDVREDPFVSCESCKKRYCATCSAATSEAVECHDGMTCKDNQALGGKAGERHVQFIRDRILTLSCPQCKSAFLDFDGCTSVHCGNVTCNVYFCANCLDFSTHDSSISHAHIRQCDKNPNRGSFFASEAQLKLVHKTRRSRQLTEYLTKSILDIRQRRQVLRCIARDLRDLGITIPANVVQCHRPTPPLPATRAAPIAVPVAAPAAARAAPVAGPAAPVARAAPVAAPAARPAPVAAQAVLVAARAAPAPAAARAAPLAGPAAPVARAAPAGAPAARPAPVAAQAVPVAARAAPAPAAARAAPVAGPAAPVARAAPVAAPAA